MAGREEEEVWRRQRQGETTQRDSGKVAQKERERVCVRGGVWVCVCVEEDGGVGEDSAGGGAQ